MSAISLNFPQIQSLPTMTMPTVTSCRPLYKTASGCTGIMESSLGVSERPRRSTGAFSPHTARPHGGRPAVLGDLCTGTLVRRSENGWSPSARSVVDSALGLWSVNQSYVNTKPRPVDHGVVTTPSMLTSTTLRQNFSTGSECPSE